jgi:hypothetical protein
MRRPVLIIFVLLAPLISIGQAGKVLPGKESDSLKNLIRQLNERNLRDSVKDFVSWRYYRIGECYEGLGEHNKAIGYYRLSLLTNDFDFGMFKRRHFGSLASEFLKRQQYDSILYYYQVVERSRPKKPGCGMGSMSVYTNYKYWLMAALDGKGMTDSAINVFLPYAFQEWTNNEGTEFSTAHLYDNDYHCQVTHFLDILKKKYCLEDIYNDVMAFTNPSNYLNKQRIENNTCFQKITFKLSIGKYVHEFYEGDQNCNDYNKEWLVDMITTEIRHSFIYSYLPEKKNSVISPAGNLISPGDNL